MSTRTFRVGLCAIALGAFVVRVLYVVLIAKHVAMGLDALWYTLVAQPVAHGKGLVDPATYFQSGRSVATAAHPPLYPAFLGAVTRVLGGHPATFRLVGAAMGTVTVVFTGGIGRRVASPTVGLVAAGLAAVYPSLIAVDGSLMSETISIPLFTATIWLALVTIEHPTWWRFALLGVLGGLTALARADALILATFVIVSTAYAVVRPTRDRAALALLAFAALALVVTPWIIRNDVQVGTPTIATTSTTQTISGANCSSTYSGSLLGYWDPRCADDGSRGTLGEAAWSSRERRQGVDYARAHPGRAVVVVAARELRVFGLFHPLSQARLDAIETRSYRWQLLAWAVSLPVLVLGTLGLIRIARTQGRTAMPLFAAVAAVVVTVAVSYGNQRFRSACEPVLLVGAAVTLVSWSQRNPFAQRWIKKARSTATHSVLENG